MLAWIDSRGTAAVRLYDYHIRILQLVYASLKTALLHESQQRRSILSVILAQVYYTGVQAMPLVGALALAVGGVVILNASALSFLADIKVIADLLVVIVVRELGPLVIALILIARSGTAIAAELGNMKVNHEIDALRVMAIDPLGYIVYPRLVGGVISIVCLTFYFNAIALLGGFAVSRLFHDLPFALYTEALSESLSVRDVSLFLVKSLLNGVTIFSICCDQGLQVVESPHEVPQATTRAVIHSISAVAVITLLATAIFYFAPMVPWGEWL